MSDPFVIITIKASQLDPPHNRAACKACGHERGYLARYIKTNGNIAVRWVCDRCEGYTTSSDLPHSVCDPIPVERLPLRLDHSDDAPDMPDCVRCGLRSDEFHHWAPSSIFPDWPFDLGAYLCFNCHREWHERMRAHGLRWPHEIRDAV